MNETPEQRAERQARAHEKRMTELRTEVDAMRARLDGAVPPTWVSEYTTALLYLVHEAQHELWRSGWDGGPRYHSPLYFLDKP